LCAHDCKKPYSYWSWQMPPNVFCERYTPAVYRIAEEAGWRVRRLVRRVKRDMLILERKVGDVNVTLVIHLDRRVEEVPIDDWDLYIPGAKVRR